MDSYSVQHCYLDESITARYVKFHPLTWYNHPSMRVELLGCQACREGIALPPFGKLTASSEKFSSSGEASTCAAADGYLLTSKAWCPRRDNGRQWLQFDIGPATLVTGVVTKGRGDGRQDAWVVRYRISYSNDSKVWFYHREYTAKHVTGSAVNFYNMTSYGINDLVPDIRNPQGTEFGGNSDATSARTHYFGEPFTARFVRLHPVKWHEHIALRASLFGCSRSIDECEAGFMRVNLQSPCVENLAFSKASWISSGVRRRQYRKRHARRRWNRRQDEAGRRRPGQQATMVTGAVQHGNETVCAVLDSSAVDRPVWVVDLGRKFNVGGVVIVMSTTSGNNETDDGDNLGSSVIADELTANVDKLVVHLSNKAGLLDSGGRRQTGRGPVAGICGTVSVLPGGDGGGEASRLHVPCKQRRSSRFVHVEAVAVAEQQSRVFGVKLCKVMVYE